MLHMSQVERSYDPRSARTLPATERGETTRRNILEAAALAFAERGYAGASLNDVISRSRVTKGGFYFHFPSKEALALAVLRYKQEQWAGKVMAAAMRHPTAIDQLVAMPNALVDLYEQDPSARCLQRLCLELSEDPELAPEMATQFTAWIELTAALIRAAQKQGSLRTDVDPDAAAEAAVAAFVGLEEMSTVTSRGKDLRERVERFVRLYLVALRAPQA